MSRGPLARAGGLSTLLVWFGCALAPSPGVAGPITIRDATITLGLALEPPNLDPTATSAEATQDVVYGNVYEGLTRITERGEVAPALAERWTVTDDGLHYRFVLRPGVRFHDGSALTAADVQASLDRARAAGSTNPLHDLLSPVAAVRLVDERTIDIDLARPVADLLTYLGWGNLVVLSPAHRAEAATHPVGTGPFRFVAWRKGDSVVLERNPDYWGPPARLSRVTFRVIPDASSALSALLAGDVDGYANFPVPESVASLERDPRFTVAIGSTEGETLLAINNRRAPFDDIRVRRALAMAIDRSALIQGAMYGYGQPIGSHFPPHDAAYVDLTGRYPHDPDAARRLLREAGHPNGLDVTLRLPPPYYARRSGEIIAAQLAAVGVRAHIQNIEWAQWLDQVFKNHDFDLTIVSHTEPMDYDIYSRSGYYFGYHSDTYDARLEELIRTRDGAKRRDLLAALQRQLADDCVNVWLFELPKLGVWRRDLRGLWREAPVQGIPLAGAWLDGAARASGAAGAGIAGRTWLGAALLVLAALAAVALRRHVGARYLAGRLGSLVVTLAGASIVIFLLVSVLPGDPAAYMMGLNASPSAIAALRAEYGLDVPAWQQYLHWILGFLRGDLGESYTYRVAVTDLVADRLVVSLPLALLALGLSVMLAVPLAFAAAAKPRSAIDRMLMGLAQLGLAIPNFWLGLLLVLVFSVQLHWLPAGGFPGWDAGPGSALGALILPALSLALPQACILARVLRHELGLALIEDYVRTARAKGAGPLRVLARHALPNALIPTLTILGLQFSFLLAGSIIVETVYALPGLGRLLFQATAQRDLIVVRSVVLLLVATVVVVNLLVELLWAVVDPRLRGRGTP